MIAGGSICRLRILRLFCGATESGTCALTSNIGETLSICHNCYETPPFPPPRRHAILRPWPRHRHQRQASLQRRRRKSRLPRSRVRRAGVLASRHHRRRRQPRIRQGWRNLSAGPNRLPSPRQASTRHHRRRLEIPEGLAKHLRRHSSTAPTRCRRCATKR